jgi:hypothetical protein
MPDVQAVREIGQVAQVVRDVARSTRCSGQAIGPPLLYTFGTGIFFDCGGTRLFIQEVPARDRKAGSTGDVLVDDITAAHRGLIQRGVAFADAPHVIHPHGHRRRRMDGIFRRPRREYPRADESVTPAGCVGALALGLVGVGLLVKPAGTHDRTSMLLIFPASAASGVESAREPHLPLRRQPPGFVFDRDADGWGGIAHRCYPDRRGHRRARVGRARWRVGDILAGQTRRRAPYHTCRAHGEQENGRCRPLHALSRASSAFSAAIGTVSVALPSPAVDPALTRSRLNLLPLTAVVADVRRRQ